MNISRFFFPKTPFNILRQKYDQREQNAIAEFKEQAECNSQNIPAEIIELKHKVVDAYNNDDAGRAERYLQEIFFLEDTLIKDRVGFKLISMGGILRSKSRKDVLETADTIHTELSRDGTPIDLAIERAKRGYYDRVEAEETEYDEYLDSLTDVERLEEFNRKHCDYDNSGFEEYKRNQQANAEEHNPFSAL